MLKHMPTRVLPLILLSLCSATYPLQLWAEDKSFEQRVIETSDNLAERIDKAAEFIDITLAGKKYTKKANTSSVSVSQLVTTEEGGRLRNSTDFGLNIQLPNVERRWQLRFTSFDEEAENRDLNQRQIHTRPRERDYGAALFFFQKLGNIRTTFQPRLQLKDPLQMSYVLRFQSAASQKSFRIEPRLELYADPIKGTGEFFSIGIAKDITKKLDVVLQNTEEYRERGNFFSTQHGLSFDYSLSRDQAMGLSFTVASSSRPKFHTDSLTVAMPFGQQIYQERLSCSLTPFLGFAKNEAFKGRAGATFNLDVIF